MSKTNHANRCKKVYEAEKLVKDDGYFVFRRTSPHGLFHIIGFKNGKTKMVQVLRLHRFTENCFNNEMIKIMEFAQENTAPPNTTFELWIWVNHRGWMKYTIDERGNYDLFEDFGFHHYRMTKHYEPESGKELRQHRGY